MNQLKRYNLFSLTIFNLIATLIAEQNSSFSLQNFGKDQNFDANFTLLGDAKVTNEGNLVNLTSSSSGQIVYNKPFKFIDSLPSKAVSFTSEFTFTIGGGVAFVILPSDVEFSNVFGQGYFGLSEKYDGNFVALEYDLNGGRVGVEMGGSDSSVVSNGTSFGLNVSRGVPVKTWIDYEAGSKRLDVRLAETGSDRPTSALISYPVDLSRMWGDGDVLVGISSSRGNSSQSCSISSWSFVASVVSSTLHSVPVEKGEFVPRRKSCFLTVLGGVIFATGCGTMVAFLALFAWVIVFGRHSNVVPELAMNPVDFKYEKVNVTVDNVGDDESMRSSSTTRSSTS
ncbi:hypothetical protein vseg_006651 [Gypsophila vaccaria]